mmetsp:Transcript_50985/g.165061  ORF Transcript_50985/g.165061 Transcript_50985/m.165061 type:complete len:97 (+) Transcript_50985:207-497(+)
MQEEIGHTSLSSVQVGLLCVAMAEKFTVDDYNVMGRSCMVFARTLGIALTGKDLPPWSTSWLDSTFFHWAAKKFNVWDDAKDFTEKAFMPTNPQEL